MEQNQNRDFHCHVPFSYPEIESTWSTAKCRGRKSWQMILHGYLFNTLLRFSSKSKAINVFHILKSKGRDQLSQARKKLFCLVIVKTIWATFHESFLFKIESMWRCKIKEQAPQLTLLYLGMTIRSSHQRCCIRKQFLKILQDLQETPVSESFFQKFADF